MAIFTRAHAALADCLAEYRCRAYAKNNRALMVETYSAHSRDG
jgi:hypothetical protein